MCISRHSCSPFLHFQTQSDTEIKSSAASARHERFAPRNILINFIFTPKRLGKTTESWAVKKTQRRVAHTAKMNAPNAGLPPHLKAAEVSLGGVAVFVAQTRNALLFFCSQHLASVWLGYHLGQQDMICTSLARIILIKPPYILLNIQY